jgi:hypothetical protein
MYAMIDSNPAAPSSRFPESTSEEILEMHEAYQSVQNDIMDLISQGVAQSELRGKAMQMISLKKKHASRMHEIVQAYGWPSAEDGSEEMAEAVFELVKNADHDQKLQQSALDALWQQRREGKETSTVLAQRIALLTDTIRATKGQPQVYGTKISAEGGEIVSPVVESPGELDNRREQLGLPPYKDYLEKVRSEIDLSLFG